MIFTLYGITRYSIALMDMEILTEGVMNGQEERIIITEHDAVYTAGKSFESNDFLKDCYPLYYTKRGGRVTVHSTGQIVVYPIIDLERRQLGVGDYVALLEEWIINVLDKFSVNAFRSDRGIGIWTQEGNRTGLMKIGFIGIRIVKGIASHGFCININNDLGLFDAIIPCGIDNVGITSLKSILGYEIEMEDVITAIVQTCPLKYTHVIQ
jgi:lipoyl(octanoyl) transferase